MQTTRLLSGIFHRWSASSWASCEVFVERDDCTLQYQASGEHKSDIFTKPLDPASFEVAVARANLRHMKPRTA